MTRYYRPKNNHKFTISFELEYGDKTVEYEMDFEASPYIPAKTYGPPEKCYPAEGPEINWKEAYCAVKVPCKHCRGTGYASADGKSFGVPVPEGKCPKCRGKACTEDRQRRPELDELVDDAVLLEYASDDEYASQDAPDPHEPDEDSFLDR